METIANTLCLALKEKSVDYFKVAPCVWGLRIVFVNVYFISTETHSPGSWILVDTGLKGYQDIIIDYAESLFGEGTAPTAIVLTHGHFDHVGSLNGLLKVWDVPVYAHYLELPFLKGMSSYPPPDPFAGGGVMTLLSRLYPRRPLNLGKQVKSLQDHEALIFFGEWQVIHCPGHSPGQIALFREGDGVLISADAIVTTRQESVMSVIRQAKILSGPPRYFTIDWQAARSSVQKLAGLNPNIIASGHGRPLSGPQLKQSLTYLLDHFDEEAVPDHGRYVKEPVRTNKYGVQYIPRPVVNSSRTIGAVIAATSLLLIAAFLLERKPRLNS